MKGKKFWKNTMEIREARARSSSSWGDRRYLLTDEEAKRATSDKAPSLTSSPARLQRNGSVAGSRSTTVDSVSEEESENKDDLIVGIPISFAKRSPAASPRPHTSEAAPVEFVKMLTEGHFGQIFVVKDRSTQTMYLMHVYKKNQPLSPQYEKLFRDMALLNHPYIFQQIHFGETTDSIFAIYSYAIDQSLFVHLRQHRRLPEHVARLFIAEVVLALDYLHKQELTFSKLEPENIFLDEDGHTCISDFLLCLPSAFLPAEAQTPEYKTPEALSGQLESFASDWWRLGILLYELTVGFPPFRSKTHDADELAQKITSHKVESLRFPPFLSSDAQDLIRRLLHTDPSERLGSSAYGEEEVKRHPFFKEIDWQALSVRQVTSPDWVDEMLQNERRSARAKDLEAISDTPKACHVVVNVVKARGLPGLRSNGCTSDPYCVVTFEDRVFQTKVMGDTVKPTWDETFHFEVQQAAKGELLIKVFHHDGNAQAYACIGTVNIPLPELKAARHINAWYSIIGQDCIAHGELLLSMGWVEKSAIKRIEPPTKSPRTFAQLFGLNGTQNNRN